jgi:hypothetical protein
MGLDEVKAATPQTPWRDSRLAIFSRRPTAITSMADLPIHGLAFHVEALASYFQHTLRLHTALRAANASACESTVLNWLGQVEGQAGPFQSQPPRQVAAGPNSLQWNVQRQPGGSVNVTPSLNIGAGGRVEGLTVAAGLRSTVLVEAFDELHRARSRKGLFGGEPERLTLSAFNHGRFHRVDVKAEFSPSDALNCSLQVEMEQWTQPPAPRVFDASRAKLTGQPSLAERHWATSPSAPPLRQAVDVQLLCEIETLNGQVRRCGVQSPTDLNRLHTATAMRLAQSQTYDLTGVDRDNPQPLQATIQVRLDPSDRQPIDFLDQAITAPDDLVWQEQPNDDERRRAYPVGLKAEIDPVSVSLTCRILSDLSLVCGGAQAPDIPHRHEFVFAATRLASLGYRAASQLRQGQPSAGRVVRLLVELRHP